MVKKNRAGTAAYIETVKLLPLCVAIEPRWGVNKINIFL